jgi:phage N-6-adenine-methyltransferase
MQQLTIFDYASLDSESRIIIKQRTDEIKTLVRNTAQNLIYIGQKLSEVQEHLRHNKSGGFSGWLKLEFDWEKRTAYNYISVFNKFGNCANFAQLDIAVSALYYLSSPSVPEEARMEVLERANSGETITPSIAKSIVESHKESSQSINEIAPISTELKENPDAYQKSVLTEIQQNLEPEKIETSDIEVVESQAQSNGPENEKTEGSGDEWYTREEEIKLVRMVLGEIDLDPASCQAANEIVKAKTFYTKEENGLDKPLWGKVFCNPPYSKPRPFIDKIVESYQSGEIESAILLVNSSTDTDWFHFAFENAKLTCFTDGRISFWRADTNEKKDKNRYGQAFFYFGNEPEKFKAVFSNTGSFAICVN